jgi:ABC-type nitrate/sulfonate/bicarbonate transport system substrate-binding protein
MKSFSRLCVFLTAGFLVLSIFAGALTAADNSLPVIRLAYLRVIDDLPFYVGIEKKFFEQEGVHVELSRLEGDTNVLAAVMRDDIQAAIIYVTQLYAASEKDIPIKVVAWLGRTHKGTRCGLHVRRDSDIKSFRDLRGKRIAVSTDIGDRALVLEALAKGGMTARDAQLILGMELNQPMQHEAVLKTGRVDAVIA